MSRPRLLDLFSGAGGAAMGYHRAGFEVFGVDVAPQPHYPFDFHQADAFDFMRLMLEPAPSFGFDAIHASPICQGNTPLRFIHGRTYPDLIAALRPLLIASGLPYVIENVPGAPMRPDVQLCGSQFGLRVRRHRWFEFSSPPFDLMPPCDHSRPIVGVYGHPGGSSKRDGDTRETTAGWSDAMGIGWMTSREIAQAIPPAYTEWIGARLIAVLGRRVTPARG